MRARAGLQHDILWETLTARQHMIFYGRLKNLRGAELREAVVHALKQVGLVYFLTLLPFIILFLISLLPVFIIISPPPAPAPCVFLTHGNTHTYTRARARTHTHTHTCPITLPPFSPCHIHSSLVGFSSPP
jgi:hypothetical protein